MFCHECGQFLTGKENFCSSCGTKVKYDEPVNKKVDEEAVESIGFAQDSHVLSESPKSKMPDMNWNLSEFTPKAEKKENPVIFWRTEDMFMGRELKEDKVRNSFTDMDDKKETDVDNDNGENKEDSFEVPDIFNQKKDDDKPSFLKGLDDFETEELTASSSELSEVAKKEYPAYENSELGLVIDNSDQGSSFEDVGSVDLKESLSDEPEVEIEQPSSNLGVEIVGDGDKEIPISNEPALTSVILGEKEIENLEAIINEAKRQEQEEIEDISISLFDEIADNVVDTLENSRIDEEKKRIDKFYTFNKKKEEFQRLLDKEYERIENNIEKGGLEEAVSGFIDVEVGKDVEGTSQLEEMIKAREMFFDSPVTLEIINDQVESSASDESPVSDEDIDSYKLEDDNQEEDSLAEEQGENIEEVISENAQELREQMALKTLEENDSPEDAKEDVSSSEDHGDFILDKVSDKEGKVTFEPSKDEENNSSEKPEFLREKNTYVQVPFVDEEEKGLSVQEERESQTPEGIKVDEGQNGEPARVIIDPKKQDEIDREEKDRIGDEFFAEEELPKRSKFVSFLIGLLIVLLITVGGLFAIRVTMPTSYISQYIDEVSTKILNLFNSDTSDEKVKVSEPKKEEIEVNPSDEKTDESKDIVEKSVETEKKQQ